MDAFAPQSSSGGEIKPFLLALGAMQDEGNEYKWKMDKDSLPTFGDDIKVLSITLNRADKNSVCDMVLWKGDKVRGNMMRLSSACPSVGICTFANDSVTFDAPDLWEPGYSGVWTVQLERNSGAFSRAFCIDPCKGLTGTERLPKRDATQLQWGIKVLGSLCDGINEHAFPWMFASEMSRMLRMLKQTAREASEVGVLAKSEGHQQGSDGRGFSTNYLY